MPTTIDDGNSFRPKSQFRMALETDGLDTAVGANP